MKARSMVGFRVLPVTALLFCWVMGLQAGQIQIADMNTPGAREAAGSCPGDVNLDGSRDLPDVIRLLRHVTNAQPLTGDGLANADLDRNGTVNLQDAVRLQQYLIKLEILPDCPAITTPRISSVSPQRGTPGSTVTITGMNFGATSQANVVRFAGDEDPVSIVSASSTRLVVTVPDYYFGGVHKNITVTAGGNASNAAAFVVDRFEPQAVMEPLSRLGGSSPPISLSIQQDSGDLQIQNLRFHFDNAALNIAALTKNSSIGRGYLGASFGDGAQGLFLITDIEGSTAKVRVMGADGTQTGNLVSGTMAPSGSGFDLDLIIARSPQGISQYDALQTSMKLMLYLDPGWFTLPNGNGTPFKIVTSMASLKPVGGSAITRGRSAEFTTVLPAAGSPVIRSVNPLNLSFRQELTIEGSGFGSAASEQTVSFTGLFNNRVNGTVISANSTSLTVYVPAGAVTGPIRVARAGAASNDYGIWMSFSPALQLSLTGNTANANTGFKIDLQESQLQLATQGFLVLLDRGSWNFSALKAGAKIGQSTGRVGQVSVNFDIHVEETDGSSFAVLIFKKSSGEVENKAKIIFTRGNDDTGVAIQYALLSAETIEKFSVNGWSWSGMLTFTEPVFKNPSSGQIAVRTYLSSSPPSAGFNRPVRASVTQTLVIP